MDDLQRIELLIELDKGIAPEELAQRSGVALRELQALARSLRSEPPAASAALQKQKTRWKEAERALIVERVQQGAYLDAIAEEYDLRLSTLKTWCKKAGIRWQRRWQDLSKQERTEVQLLLEEGESWEELARAFHMHLAAEASVPPPPHTLLSVEERALLLEIFAANPKTSIAAAMQLGAEAGMSLVEERVASYKRRYLKMI
jgi:transposase